MAKKSLKELFESNAETKDNHINVASDFYYSQVGVDKKTVDKVNKANMDFVKTAAEVTRDSHIDILKSNTYDGVSTTFATGTDGFSFQQHTTLDDTDSGISTFSEISQNHGDSLDSVYESYGKAFEEASAGDEDGEAKEE